MASVKRFLMIAVGISSARGSETKLRPKGKSGMRKNIAVRYGSNADHREAEITRRTKGILSHALGAEIRTTTSPVEVTG